MAVKHIAILINAGGSYRRKIIASILAYARTRRQWRLFVQADPTLKLPDLRQWKLDGIISDFDKPEMARAATAINVPAVNTGGGWGRHDPHLPIPCFVTDNDQIGQWAAEHLLERGFRQFAFCGYPKTQPFLWSEERAVAFARRLAKAGFDCSMHRSQSDQGGNWSDTLEGLMRWLAALPKPLGVMAANDQLAQHLLVACRNINARVPEDVAIIGVDNDEMLCEAHPSLTSIEQGTRQIGTLAARMLERMMTGYRPKQLRFLVPPERIVMRQSTDVVASNDPLLLNALRFIRDHACEGICVKNVLGIAGVCRTTLESRFQAGLQRSVHEEILRVRLEHARELVTKSNLPLKDVAKRTGFCDVQYLTNVFRRATGFSPSQYRQRQRG